MAAFTFEILLIVLLLIVNGVFAMSEMAVISARKARLQQWAKDGSTKAGAALELARAPGHFLSTIQIAITLVGILAGAIGGTTLAQKLSDSLNLVPLLAPYSEALGLGTVVISISYFSLVIGELAPKRIALYSPERIASAVAIPMRRRSI
jgi:putative hemolysin